MDGRLAWVIELGRMVRVLNGLTRLAFPAFRKEQGRSGGGAVGCSCTYTVRVKSVL